MTFTTMVLWIHALSAAIWVGVSASLVLAAIGLAGNRDEQRSFAVHSAPRLKRVMVGAAGTLLATGLLSLVGQALVRQMSFSRTFIVVLTIKVLLFCGMAALLFHEFRPETAAVEDRFDRLAKLSGAVAMMGAAALVLGLWLAGS